LDYEVPKSYNIIEVTLYANPNYVELLITQLRTEEANLKKTEQHDCTTGPKIELLALSLLATLYRYAPLLLMTSLTKAKSRAQSTSARSHNQTETREETEQKLNFKI